MTDTDPCVVCATTQAETLSEPGYDGVHQNCPRCGEFKIIGSTLGILSGGIGKEARAKLSGWVRDQYRAGTTPEINSYTYKSILARPIPSIADRAKRLLIEAVVLPTKSRHSN